MTDKNAKNENSKIRIMTFFPPFIILVAFLVLSLVDQETFLGVINNINNWIIKNLGWAASILALAIVIVAVVAMFSKFGDVRIGGEDAKPELAIFPGLLSPSQQPWQPVSSSGDRESRSRITRTRRPNYTALNLLPAVP